ncbi:uncharacterized protein LOC118755884 [Rhagoletis pomonella]|uniref:uncharacterized protein LOC118755884 n=1 Tax=Rhagoletis pomonella TaxID=28610 RepID=UPI0017803F75|nr:uncharacterized protein LOC118755884 [Rhagoletis pomonella]
MTKSDSLKSANKSTTSQKQFTTNANGDKNLQQQITQGSNKSTTSQKQSTSNANDAKNPQQQITMGSLHSVIVSLQADNSRILNSIAAQREENNKLMIKIDNMHDVIISMQRVIHEKDDAIASLKAELSDLRSCMITAVEKFNSDNISKCFDHEAVTSCANVNNVLLSAALPPVPVCDASQIDDNNSAARTNASNITVSASASVYDKSRLTPTYRDALTNMPTAATYDIERSIHTTQLTAAANTCYDTTAISTSIGTSTANTHTGTANIDQVITPAASSARSSGSGDGAQWSTAGNKKRMKRVLVVGTNANDDLNVAVQYKWLHLSSFATTVTTENIIEYVANHASVSKKALACYMLVKTNTQLSTLKRINFKLGVPLSSYERILSADIWPVNVVVRPFRFFEKTESANPPT